MSLKGLVPVIYIVYYYSFKEMKDIVKSFLFSREKTPNIRLNRHSTDRPNDN